MHPLTPGRHLAIALLAISYASNVHSEPVAYVPIAAAFEVQLIDTRNGNTVGHIPVAGGPIGIAMDTARQKLYVAHQGGNRITAISTLTRQVIGTLTLPTDAWGIAVSPDGTRLYVALSGLDQLGIVDSATLSLIGTVATGATPRNVVVSADGTRVYVSNQNSATMSVIDTTTQTAVGEFPLTSAPLGLALRPGGATAYAVGAFGDELVRFDTASNSVVGAHPAGDGPSGVAVNADGSRIYVTATADDAVTVFNGSDHSLLATIPVGDGPYGLAVSSDGSRVYVVNVYGESMSVIDASSNTVVATYPLSGGAFTVGGFLAAATVPDAPLIDTPLPAAGSASISFSAPAFDGGDAITHFSALCMPGAIGASNASAPILVAGLSDGVVYRCTVRAHNAIGAGPASAEASVIPGNNGNLADLSISKTNAASFVNGGDRVGYLIVVENPGPAAVAAATVSDTLESDFSAAQWQCSGSNGAQCPASGQGNLDIRVDLPIGSSVAIQISALLAPLPEDPVSNTAAVSLPAAMSDTNLANNVASDGPDLRGIFRDSFE